MFGNVKNVVLVAVVCLVTAAGLGFAVFRMRAPAVDPIPGLNDFDGVTVQFWNGKPNFEIPSERWGAIRRGLVPAYQDDHPHLWATLGQLAIQAKDGRTTMVYLYDVGDPGAFSMARADGSGMQYYRGGATETLRRIFVNAYAEAGL